MSQHDDSKDFDVSQLGDEAQDVVEIVKQLDEEQVKALYWLLMLLETDKPVYDLLAKQMLENLDVIMDGERSDQLLYVLGLLEKEKHDG